MSPLGKNKQQVHTYILPLHVLLIIQHEAQKWILSHHRVRYISHFLKCMIFIIYNTIPTTYLYLTEIAGEGGPHLAPQKFLLSQKFRHLMRCKKYLEKKFLSCLVSEIQLFVYIFGWISKWPPEVRKGSLAKFFEVSYYQNFF